PDDRPCHRRRALAPGVRPGRGGHHLLRARHHRHRRSDQLHAAHAGDRADRVRNAHEPAPAGARVRGMNPGRRRKGECTRVKLAGRTVAVTGARMADEFANIVRKMGGFPLVFPAQGIVKADDEAVAERLRELFAAPVDWFVLTTGFGTETLLEKAEAAGCRERLLELMKSTPIAARGYKTANALRKL